MIISHHVLLYLLWYMICQIHKYSFMFCVYLGHYAHTEQCWLNATYTLKINLFNGHARLELHQTIVFSMVYTSIMLFD